MDNKKKADGIKKGLIVSLIGAVLLMGIFFAMMPTGKAGALTAVSATPDSYVAGETTNYYINFTTNLTATLQCVNMTFATGFNVNDTGKGAIDYLGAGTVLVSNKSYHFPQWDKQAMLIFSAGGLVEYTKSRLQVQKIV